MPPTNSTQSAYSALDQRRRESQIVLGVLDAVESNQNLTQRDLALQVGIALGLTNAYLKRCIRKGLIKVGQVPARRYSYYLTPRGFAEKSRLMTDYLVHSLGFFRNARMQCEEIFALAAARNQHRVALIGQGELAEIAGLIAKEHAVEVAGVVTTGNKADRLADAIKALKRVDAVVLTSLVRPREVYDVLQKSYSPDRIYVPELLRLNVQTKARTK